MSQRQTDAIDTQLRPAAFPPDITLEPLRRGQPGRRA